MTLSDPELSRCPPTAGLGTDAPEAGLTHMPAMAAAPAEHLKLRDRREAATWPYGAHAMAHAG